MTTSHRVVVRSGPGSLLFGGLLTLFGLAFTGTGVVYWHTDVGGAAVMVIGGLVFGRAGLNVLVGRIEVTDLEIRYRWRFREQVISRRDIASIRIEDYRGTFKVIAIHKLHSGDVVQLVPTANYGTARGRRRMARQLPLLMGAEMPVVAEQVEPIEQTLVARRPQAITKYRRNFTITVALWTVGLGAFGFCSFFMDKHERGPAIAAALVGITGIAVMWIFAYRTGVMSKSSRRR